jgi:hypothetical protein
MNRQRSCFEDWADQLTTDSIPRTGLHAAAVGMGAAASRRRHPNAWWAAGLTLLAATGYSAFSLMLQYKAQTNAYDLGIFVQAVQSYAHFHPGISSIIGYYDFSKGNFSLLGDHWSPIIAVLGPAVLGL